MKQQDQLRRFLFENAGVRGEWVRLEKSWQQAKEHQKIVNRAVESQLGGCPRIESPARHPAEY